MNEAMMLSYVNEIGSLVRLFMLFVLLTLDFALLKLRDNAFTKNYVAMLFYNFMTMVSLGL